MNLIIIVCKEGSIFCILLKKESLLLQFFFIFFNCYSVFTLAINSEKPLAFLEMKSHCRPQTEDLRKWARLRSIAASYANARYDCMYSLWILFFPFPFFFWLFLLLWKWILPLPNPLLTFKGKENNNILTFLSQKAKKTTIKWKALSLIFKLNYKLYF